MVQNADVLDGLGRSMGSRELRPDAMRDEMVEEDRQRLAVFLSSMCCLLLIRGFGTLVY